MYKAIDLYSGIGGWTLGLKMAGIKVLASYEWWPDANNTHNKNFGKDIPETNIRELKLGDLPSPNDVDIVVGSPPCTQFSFSNKGGKGDIEDGLKDVQKFLQIVRHLKPIYWAMENVPRVSGILDRELSEGGQLEEFKDLVKVNEVINIAEFGLPQRRKRMIAGDFPKELLYSYKEKTSELTLGDIVKALKGDPVLDPIFGIELPMAEVTDLEKEEALSIEEERMNRESKTFHPVYNKMQFPDPLDRSSRTVTAVCTRVSRESIVIFDEGKFRRLTVRERGVLQSFPISMQYYGSSYAAKIKMIGNAIPPVMTYFIAQSMMETSLKSLKLPNEASYKHPIPSVLPKNVKVETKSKKFPVKRKFRAAIPHLRFGSGMRFELANSFKDDQADWKVAFYYGSSKNIKNVEMTEVLLQNQLDWFKGKQKVRVLKTLMNLKKYFQSVDSSELQMVWTKRTKGVGPFQLVDKIGETVSKILEEIEQFPLKEIEKFVLVALNYDVDILNERKKLNGAKKIVSNSKALWSGFLVGGWFNQIFENEVVVTFSGKATV